MTDPLDRLKAFLTDQEPDDVRRHARFEVIREIGRGGTAIVYEAFDPSLKRKVALKVLTSGTLERLRREAEAAARLRHPNVVTVFEVGPDYLAMELVEGPAGVPDLKALLTVARAVAHAHESGVIHRDLKPGNVIVAGDRIVLTDFGLARIEGAEQLTRTGSIAGTPVYMAPEQVRGEISKIGPPTDVWALGVMLCEIAGGRRPFEGDVTALVYDAIQRAEPKLPAGPAGAIAARALEKDPEKRYPDAAAFAADLERLIAGQAVFARAPSVIRTTIRKVKRNPLPVLVALAVALAVAGVIVFQLWMSERGRAVEAFRNQARTALEAALELRRAGANARMKPFLDSLEEAYAGLEGKGLAEVEYLMGRMYRALNDDARALEFQEKALELDPDFAAARFERGFIHLRRHLGLATGEWEGNIDVRRVPEPVRERILEDLRASDPSPTAMGYRQLLKGSWTDAEGEFQKALGADPRLEEAREGLAAAWRAGVLEKAELKEASWAEAEALYTKGLENDKGYVPHYLARGQLRWSRGSARRHRGKDPMPDYISAEGDFTKAIELAPRHVDAWTWRGEMKVYQGIYALEMGWDARPRLAAADEDFTAALDIDPRWARTWFWRGNAHFYRAAWLLERGMDPTPDLESGERDLIEAVRLAKEPSHELRWRGRLRAQLGAARGRNGKDPEPVWKSAEEDFVRGDTKDPWHYTWWSAVDVERGAWLVATGKDPSGTWTRAEELLGEALTRNPSFDEALKQRGLLRAERAAWREGAGDRDGARTDYRNAASDFHQALAVNPNFKRMIGERLEKARRKASE
ncbi:MAG TPA: protein kinase [Planctomycetota bacterium]